MIAPYYSNIDHANVFWDVIVDVFQSIGAMLFDQWVGAFIAVVLTIGLARFVWSFVKGVL